MEALYASAPVYFPDGFDLCTDRDGDVLFVWLLPIAATEAAFVRAQGWDVFEDRLMEHDPDLTDVFREPMPVEA